MNNNKLCACLIILLAFVMVGESVPLSNIMEFDELAKALIEGGGSGHDMVDDVGNPLSGLVCRKFCRDLGQSCGFRKGVCCSDSSCVDGACKRLCKALGESCGFQKGICCSDSSCVGGTCKRLCKALGEDCGFRKGICCSDSSCVGGTCKRLCKEEGQACGFQKGICCSGTRCDGTDG